MFQECSQVYIRREGSVEGPLCPLQIKDIVLQKYRRVSWKITHLVATKCWSNMQCNELFPVCKYYRCKIVCTAIWIFAEVKITTELDKNVNKLCISITRARNCINESPIHLKLVKAFTTMIFKLVSSGWPVFLPPKISHQRKVLKKNLIRQGSYFISFVMWQPQQIACPYLFKTKLYKLVTSYFFLVTSWHLDKQFI